jgi:hypothetical protein
VKVVFPCKGSIVLTKNDVETLEAFYNTKLLTSKMAELYKSSEFMLQVGNFKYLPKHYSVRLHNANLMNIRKMRELLGLPVTPSMPEPTPPTPSVQIVNKGQNLDEQKISDASLLSHPFFQTLKPVD